MSESAVDIERRVSVWLKALESRHLADLTFAEVTRALRALSSCYVERRQRLTDGAALDGTGKRAAFALYYGLLHFLLLRHIVTEVQAVLPGDTTIVDLGCGTGVAGAAWALASESRPRVVGVDRSPWAVGEAEWTWRTLGLQGRARRGDLLSSPWPRGRLAVVSAFTANELPADGRGRLLERLAARAGHGDAVLVVEPVARGVAPWWDGWQRELASAGARTDEWRVQTPLPDIVARLDRAVGLNHNELTGRSLFVPLRPAA